MIKAPRNMLSNSILLEFFFCNISTKKEGYNFENDVYSVEGLNLKS